MDYYALGQSKDIDKIFRAYKNARLVNKQAIIKGLRDRTDNDYLIGIMDHIMRINNYDNAEALIIIFQTGNKSLIDHVISTSKYSLETNWSKCLIGACMGGHLDIVFSIIIMIPNMITDTLDWNMGFYAACYSGNKALINSIKHRYKHHINLEMGLLGACEGGHKDIAESIIQSGLRKYDGGIDGLCQGHPDDVLPLIDFIMSYYNYDWNLCLWVACKKNSIFIIDYALNKGANDLEWALRGAIINNHYNIAKYILSLGLDKQIDRKCQDYYKYLASVFVKRCYCVPELSDQLNGLMKLY